MFEGHNKLHNNEADYVAIRSVEFLFPSNLRNVLILFMD